MITENRFETERLILRKWKIDDLDDFYEYARVEGVGEKAGWAHHKNIDETKNILKIFMAERGNFAIEYKENNKVIGSIEIRPQEKSLPIDEGKINGNVGFVLSKDYWGRGIIPEAAGFLIDYVFSNNLVDNIYMGYYDHNAQSKRVQEKLGLKKIGETNVTTRFGKVEHLIMMRISKEDCQEKNS